MRPYGISRSSLTINSIWKVRGRRPTLRRTCKVYIPRDLRELDTLRLPATYEEDHFLVQKLKTFTKHKLHHFILVLVIACYLYAGALLFQFLDTKCEVENSGMNVSAHREVLLRQIYNVSVAMIEEESDWMKTLKTAIELHESRVLRYSSEKSVVEEAGTRRILSIRTCIFFCFTVITTIGYGNISPCTDTFRAVTTLYAVFGVPLMILVLADLGKLFTKGIKFIVRHLQRFYQTGTFRQSNQSDITEDKPLQYMTVSWRTVRQDKIPDKTKDDMSVQNPASEYHYNQVTTLTIHNDDLYKNLDFLNPDEKNHKHVEVEDDFTLPVSLAVALVLIYMVVGGFLFALWEEWTFFEAFYFVFISMTTIGFGDYVPTQEEYMMGAFAYLVLGLMLTSMCINVIQEKLTATFQKARVRIGNNTVLNVNALLQDEGHKSRTPKSNTCDPQECYAFKMALHKDSFSSIEQNSLSHMRPSRTQVNILEKLSENDTKSDSGKEIQLKVPVQNRFTFYDSPYNTIQDENDTTKSADIMLKLPNSNCSANI